MAQPSEQVAQTEDNSIRVRLYEDGSIRLSVTRGTRYAIRRFTFDDNGGNVELMPIGAGSDVTSAD